MGIVCRLHIGFERPPLEKSGRLLTGDLVESREGMIAVEHLTICFPVVTVRCRLVFFSPPPPRVPFFTPILSIKIFILLYSCVWGCLIYMSIYINFYQREKGGQKRRCTYSAEAVKIAGLCDKCQLLKCQLLFELSAVHGCTESIYWCQFLLGIWFLEKSNFFGGPNQSLPSLLDCNFSMPFANTKLELINLSLPKSNAHSSSVSRHA